MTSGGPPADGPAEDEPVGDEAAGDEAWDDGTSDEVLLDEAVARAEASPAAVARWRLIVGLGALLLAGGWMAWPVVHVMEVERPLRYIAGSPWTFAFAAHVAAATWVLTVRPPFALYAGHGAGTWFLRGLAALGVGLAALETWLGHHPIALGLIGWLEYPVVIVWLGMGFAYLGRLLRLEYDGRWANLADLVGVALLLLWVASQLVSGYPTLPLIVPGGVGMVLAAVVMGVLALRYLRPSRALGPGGP